MNLVQFIAKVESIAHLVGCEDPFYFCRLFKRTVGKTPAEYRSEPKKASSRARSKRKFLASLGAATALLMAAAALPAAPTPPVQIDLIAEQFLLPFMLSHHNCHRQMNSTHACYVRQYVGRFNCRRAGV